MEYFVIYCSSNLLSNFPCQILLWVNFRLTKSKQKPTSKLLMIILSFERRSSEIFEGLKITKLKLRFKNKFWFVIILPVKVASPVIEKRIIQTNSKILLNFMINYLLRAFYFHKFQVQFWKDTVRNKTWIEYSFPVFCDFCLTL